MIMYDVLYNPDGTLMKPTVAERDNEFHSLEECLIIKVDSGGMDYVARKRDGTSNNCIWEIDPGYKSFVNGNIVTRESLLDWLKINYPIDFEFIMWNIELLDGKYNG